MRVAIVDRGRALFIILVNSNILINKYSTLRTRIGCFVRVFVFRLPF